MPLVRSNRIFQQSGSSITPGAEQSDHTTDIEDHDDSQSVMLKLLEEYSGGSHGSEDGLDIETKIICGSVTSVSLSSRVQPALKMAAIAGGGLSRGT